MKEKNPFDILCINKDIIKELKYDELSFLIKCMYKSLQQVYHPDKIANLQNENLKELYEQKSKEINQAYQVLNSTNKELIELLKEEYIKPKNYRKKINLLEDQIKEAYQKSDEISESFLNYLKETHNKTIISDLEKNNFNMLDYTFIKQIPQDMLKSQAFYEMHIKDNKIVKIWKSGEKEYPYKKLIGCIVESKVLDYNGIMNLLKKAKEFTTIDKVYRAIKFQGYTKFEESENMFTPKFKPDEFKEIIHFLTPRIEIHSYIFSYNKEEDTPPYFEFEGKLINKIQKTL